VGRGLVTLHHGDCIEVMAAMEPESVDAIVTDPPYGLEFMGKEWDKLWDKRGQGEARGFKGKARAPVGGMSAYIGGSRAQEWHQRWAEAAYRVAKPSAYLLAFGGTRTVHRMTCAIEDAGWIVRDMLVWAYASGFPKSKASLKPAWEPIVMARKPGPLRMLAIDACRIPAPENVGVTWTRGGKQEGASLRTNVTGVNEYVESHLAGRWPANVILTDPILDGGWDGVVGGGEATTGGNINGRPVTGYGKGWADERFFDGYGDSGTYSRFFLVPKAARSDREPVLGGLPLRAFGQSGGAQAAIARGEEYQTGEATSTGLNRVKQRANVHPTVKPTELMRHLVRLVTPTGGTVLDPFLGSGTTALAAEMEGFAWVGIEREAEYVAIAEARLNGTQRGLGLEAS